MKIPLFRVLPAIVFACQFCPVNVLYGSSSLMGVDTVLTLSLKHMLNALPSPYILMIFPPMQKRKGQMASSQVIFLKP